MSTNRRDPLRPPRGSAAGLVHLCLNAMETPSTAQEVHAFLRAAEDSLEPGERSLSLSAVSRSLRYLVIHQQALLIVTNGGQTRYKARKLR